MSVVLVLNEMVLVLETGWSTTSTAGAEYEYEYEYEKTFSQSGFVTDRSARRSHGRHVLVCLARQALPKRLWGTGSGA